MLGSAYIYSLQGSLWSFQSKIFATQVASNDNFGTTVAIFTDQIITGSTNDASNGVGSGSAYYFEQVQFLSAIPTSVPSSNPTVTPSRKPTNIPTSPTRVPTRSPTRPTSIPTLIPTSPTRIPTRFPTSPTRRPTT